MVDSGCTVEISILQWLIKREIQSWDTFSGTSMAAPHVTGAMGVLMSRYPSMNAIQVRDVMFTTANHRDPDGSLYESWTAAEGTPDVRYGWGTPDLDKGMYGRVNC